MNITVTTTMEKIGSINKRATYNDGDVDNGDDDGGDDDDDDNNDDNAGDGDDYDDNGDVMMRQRR